jgi:hypothetical protein
MTYAADVASDRRCRGRCGKQLLQKYKNFFRNVGSEPKVFWTFAWGVSFATLFKGGIAGPRIFFPLQLTDYRRRLSL